MSQILALLDDGACTISGTCLKSPHEVHSKCPQALKCGTCVAWSPREENRYNRNSGQCMLDRDAKTYLDCNAQICPYYRPRDNAEAVAAFEAFKRAPQRKVAGAKRKRSMDRAAPAPTPEALAQAAFENHENDVARAGAEVLAAELHSVKARPLLERFRGGSAEVKSANVSRKTSAEALFARLVLLRGCIENLDQTLRSSQLSDVEKSKVAKDLGGVGGSLTTFNFLFQNKEDHFRGSKG